LGAARFFLSVKSSNLSLLQSRWSDDENARLFTHRDYPQIRVPIHTVYGLHLFRAGELGPSIEAGSFDITKTHTT
jgi:hypothetical protein